MAQKGDNTKDGKVKEDRITPRLDLGFKHFNISYLQHPPRIKPNYGNKRKVQTLPESNVKRVLLYDNMTQQQMLDMKLANIRTEKYRSVRLMDLHRKSFIVQRLKKMKNMYKTDFGSYGNNLFLPPIAQTRNSIPDVQDKDESKLQPISKSLDGSESVNEVTQILDSLEVTDDSDLEGTQYKKSVKDPRFLNLEKGLYNLARPGDGYLELSPSFVKDNSNNIARSSPLFGRLPTLSLPAVENNVVKNCD